MSGDPIQLHALGDRWVLTGPLTMDSAAAVLGASRALVLPKAGVIDLEGVDRVDSAGIAVVLAWRRRAASDGKPVGFTGVPRSMTSLAELYGVEDFLAQ
jgi:phospholipid transport system transporter-binding protein